jgi:hypothetical protein
MKLNTMSPLHTPLRLLSLTALLTTTLMSAVATASTLSASEQINAPALARSGHGDDRHNDDGHGGGGEHQDGGGHAGSGSSTNGGYGLGNGQGNGGTNASGNSDNGYGTDNHHLTTPAGDSSPITSVDDVFQSSSNSSTGITTDSTTGSVLITQAASGTIRTLSNTVPANVAIQLANTVQITLGFSNGNSLKATALSDNCVLYTVQVGDTVLVQVAQGTAKLEPFGSNVLIPVSDQNHNLVGAFAPDMSKTNSLIIRRDPSTIQAYVDTGKNVYYSQSGSGAIHGADLYAGEVMHIANTGQAEQIRLGSLDGDRNLPGDPLRGSQLPTADSDALIPQLNGAVDRLGGGTLLDLVRSQLTLLLGAGGTFSFAPDTGAISYSVNGQTANLLPLGNVIVTPGSFSATNAGQTVAGSFALTDRGVQVTLTSALGYFTDFQSAIKQFDPAGKITLKRSGALQIDAANQQYFVQPSVTSQNSGISNSPSLFAAAGGLLQFRDSHGSVQQLYPTFADLTALQALLKQTDPNASVTMNGDGSALGTLAGQTVTLQPQYQTSALPAAHAANHDNWWLEQNLLHYVLTSGREQGLAIK